MPPSLGLTHTGSSWCCSCTESHFLSMSIFRSHRRRRSVGVANSTLSSTLTPPPYLANGSSPTPKPEEKLVLKVVGKESIVISNLHHFTSYQIEIQACNHAEDLDYCSVATFVSARTMPEGNVVTTSPSLHHNHYIEHAVSDVS